MATPRKDGRARHYGIDRWVDFARGLVPENTASTMADHAATCRGCRDVMTFCLKLSAAAGLLPLLPPTPPYPPGAGNKNRN